MNLAEQLKAKFPSDVTETLTHQTDPVAYVKRESIRRVCETLKDDPNFAFDTLMDLFVIDYLHWEEKALRFEVVYNLYSTTRNHRMFVKVSVPERDAAVDSVCSLWPSANWFEREGYDMFGITFKAHPNLKRILMYEEFRGHALRKDYPYNKRQPLVGPLN